LDNLFSQLQSPAKGTAPPAAVGRGLRGVAVRDLGMVAAVGRGPAEAAGRGDESPPSTAAGESQVICVFSGGKRILGVKKGISGPYWDPPPPPPPKVVSGKGMELAATKKEEILEGDSTALDPTSFFSPIILFSSYN
jgi:hypothetical protein